MGDVVTRIPALAVVGDRFAEGLAEVTDDLSALDSSGFWAVVLPFEGQPICARFARTRPAYTWPGRPWQGPDRAAWSSDLDGDAFRNGVRSIRNSIAAGDVYQVNLTRRLSAPLAVPDPFGTIDIASLGAALAEGNPAPFSAVIRLPEHGVLIASASPELYLRRDGRDVWSAPIKGTAKTEEEFLAKDQAENVMIVDLVRNDFGRVCEYGSVQVPALMAVKEAPGLVHLESTVTGRLRSGMGWAELIEATFPPGSVTGAPKLAAIEQIQRLEPSPRRYYCGGIGWVDADRGIGEINVAIRTFWIDSGFLFFGTGGGITYDSDPEQEWQETRLKADNLLRVASAVPAV
ncbi:MAG: anthranilate synthase component I family protein [Acidimicrobiales bacterium]|nr:anthranilate synthase component I family protein [Acidimicrobiales bacterium]